MDHISINHITFKAYELTHHFLKVFNHITYKDIPVARAMIFNFYRLIAIRNYENLSSKNMNMSKDQKRKLYGVLFDNEEVKQLPYNPNVAQPHKIILSRFVDVLDIDTESGIFCDEYVKDERERPPYINPANLVPLDSKVEKQLIKQIHMVSEDKKVPTIFRSKGFRVWVCKQLAHIIRLIDGIELIFMQNNIKGVVQDVSLLPMNYILVHMCKQRNIPSINIQLFLNSHYQLMSMNPDYYITFGQFDIDRMTELGVPPQKFKIIGNPRFDHIFNDTWMNKNQLARLLDFASDKLVFFYAEQPIHPEEINKVILDALIQSLYPHRDKVVFIIKKHPRQAKSTLSNSYLKKYPFIKLISTNDIQLYDLINNSDIVFTQFSCVGLEAILLDKPMISINFFQDELNREHSYFAKNPLVTSSNNLQQLNEIINNMIENPVKCKHSILEKQTIYKRYIYNDSKGTSKVRIKKFIQDITGVQI